MPNIVKNTTFISPLDLIFPHSCRGCGSISNVFCERCKKYINNTHHSFCPNCKKEKATDICPNCPDLPPIYTVANRNTIIGSLIHDFKYDSIQALAKPLADLLDSTMPNNLPPETVIVPLPTASHHIRSRGFDHTLLVAKHLSRIRHLPIKKILLRNKNTVQVGSDREKRLSQASSAYILNPKEKIDKKATYLLLDDVWTTGASVLSAVKILKGADAEKIIVALLAYSS